jgi:predicted Zn-dependent protease
MAPKRYIPIVLGIFVIACIPIAIFLRTGFVTNGSAVSSGVTPPPMIANALAELRTRIARNPKDVQALETLAGLELEAGRLESAAQLDAQAVAAAPNDTSLRSAYAEVLNDLGHGKQARDQLNIGLTGTPHNPNLRYERGIINEQLGEHQAATEDFRDFLAHSAQNDPRRAALLGRSGAH